MAFKLACSPSNMTAAPDDEDVLTKYDAEGVVMRYVDAKPGPPWLLMVDEDASMESALRMDGSMEVAVGMLGV